MDPSHKRPTVGEIGATAGAGRARQIVAVQLVSNRPARRALCVLLAVLGAIAPTPLPPDRSRFAIAQSAPTVIINPTQGPSGTTVSVSAQDFPSGDRDQTATYLFDGVQMGATTFVPCSSGPAPNGFGIGTGCSSNATPISLTVPLTAAGGMHAIAVSDPAGNVASTAFTIPQQPTATPTGTPAPPTVTTIGLPAATPPNGTASPTAAPTATATPKPAFSLIVLVYPLHLFSGGTLALSLHASAGSHIAMTLEFTAAVTSGHGHGAIQAGAVLYKHQIHGTANGAGLFWLTLHVAYTPHVRARATLIVTSRHGATAFTARRVFG